MRKAITFLLAIFMIISLMTACGSKSEIVDETKVGNQSKQGTGAKQPDESQMKAQDKVTLKFVMWDPNTREAVDQINDAFMNENPNITVETDAVPGDQYDKVIKTRFLAGEGPDTFLWFASSTFKMAETDCWGDLSDAAWADNVIPGHKKSVSYEGKLYALPIDYAAEGVFYNKKIFNEAGITELPKTWDDFLNICEILKSKGIQPMSIGGKDPWAPPHFLAPIYASFVTAKNPDFQLKIYEGETTFAGSEFETALGKVVELMDKEYIAKGALGIFASQATQKFADGEVAMTLSGSWTIGTTKNLNNDIDIGFMPVPADTGDIGIVSLPDKALGYNPAGENIDQSKKFIDFWAKPESMQMYVNYTKSLSCMKDIVADGAPPVFDEIADYLAEYGAYAYYNVYWPSSTQDEIISVIQSILAGENDVSSLANQLDESYQTDKNQAIRPNAQ